MKLNSIKNIFAIGSALVLWAACKPSFYTKEAFKAYQMQDYKKAEMLFSKADSSSVNMRMKAKCAYQTNEMEKSVRYYSFVPTVELELEDWKYYANALIKTNQKDKAIQLLENAPEGLENLYLTAKNTERNTPGVKINPTSWNTAGASFSPFVICNKVFYIGNKRNPTAKYKMINNSHDDNLKIMSIDDDYSTSCGFPATRMNSALDEGPVTMGGNRSIIVFTRNAPMNDRVGAGRPQLYEMHKKGLKWSSPKRISFCNEDAAFMHPTMSVDGNRMIFSSNRCGSKGFDLYESTFDGKSWSFPKSLGEEINTDGDEVFPYFDGDLIYYSTNGRIGYGGLDLFVFNETTAKNDHLLAPFNSGSDDFGITRRDLGYTNWLISSNRSDSLGVDHIYEVTVPKGRLTRLIVQSANGTPLSNKEVNIRWNKTSETVAEQKVTTNAKGEVEVYLPKEFEIVINGEVKYKGQMKQAGAVMVAEDLLINLK